MKKKKANLRDLDTQKNTLGEHSHDDGHNHSSPERRFRFQDLPAGYFQLCVAYYRDCVLITLTPFRFSKGWVRVVWYTVAYIPVGFPVIREGWNSIKNGDLLH